ncbi:MAG: alpha amylase C-terminal domain-containing protein [Verrucomicrobiota bacterium]|jgi:1,4-alpha-glucan branching enzyme|nr:alpha amylase C-terminal domain-containing protein [Verrucomicrobiota bacterium]
MKALRLFLCALALCSLAGAAFAQSSRPGIGAIPYDGGTTFRVWAPDVTSVAVSGSFNHWGQTPLVSEQNGKWSADIAGAKHNDEYKFILNGNMWRQDPRARRTLSSNPNDNSIIYDHRLFDWQGADKLQVYRNDLVVYEMHVGSFNAESWLPSTFDQCAEKLPHLKKLGVSAVQLMPVSEFATDRSWGYNPSFLFAPESSFGGADGLKRFVKAAHELGIAVLLDVVHNHYGPDDLPLWQFNGQGGSTGGMYFYNDERAATPWGNTRPNFGEENVRSFIIDNIREWLAEFNIDGFRWDSVFNIIYTGEGEKRNDEGKALLSHINSMMQTEYPDAFRIAEDHAEEDLHFEAQWDHTFLNEIRYLAATVSDSDRNMNVLAGHLRDAGTHQVVYVESHDTCGDLNEKHRLPRMINADDPQGYYAKKRAFLGNAVALVAPGIPMIFMGSEFNEDWDFSNNHSLQWSSLASKNAGLIQAYSDLIHLRRNSKGVSSGFKNFSNASTPHINTAENVLGYARGNDLFIVFNWNASSYSSYDIPFPSSGTWYCLFNSDSKVYDASFGGVGPAVNDPLSASPSASIDLGAYSIQVYGKSRLPADPTTAFIPPVPSGCTNVTLTYKPADGPLADASVIHAFIGRNNWRTALTVPMTRSGDTWSCTYDIPEDTMTLHAAFNDGADAWDNNDGLNWNTPVKLCGGLPAVALTEPAAPSGCGTEVKISYEVNSGPLYASYENAVYIQLGRNGWNDIQTLTMTNSFSDTWETSFSIPEDTWSLTFCFHDGNTNSSARIWDNNGGKNWSVPVSGCVVLPVPEFSITTPSTATSSVPSGVFVQTIQGTSANLVGDILWENIRTGESGRFRAASGSWTAEDVPLASGTNSIVLTALNPNHGARDEDYSAIGNGVNGGNGFAPWIIETNAPAGVWGDQRVSAWGLWANNGGLVSAIRPFLGPLQVGDSVFFLFQNGGINTGGSVGFGLYNGYQQRALEYYFNGGDNSYTLVDASTNTLTRDWTTNPQAVAFTLLADWTYSLVINEKTYTGALAPTSLDQIQRIRFWNFNAGEGSNKNSFVSSLSVQGAAELRPLLQRTLTILQPDETVEAVGLSIAADGTLQATIDGASATRLLGNIWGASQVDADRKWNWSLLNPSSYTINGQTITFDLDGNDNVNVLSIGLPPGHE